MKKLPVLSKCQQPSGTTPSRCSPKHSPFFFPQCVLSACSEDCHDPLSSINAQLQISKPVISFPFLFTQYLVPRSASGSIQAQCCVLGKNLPFVKLKGLWLVWQWRLAGQLVNNLKQDTDQGILQTSVPPRWIYKMYWGKKTSLTIGGIAAVMEDERVVPMESLSKQTKQIKSHVCTRNKKASNLRDQEGQVPWTAAAGAAFTAWKMEIISQSRQHPASVLHQQQPSVLNKRKITYVTLYIHEADL